MWNFDLSHKVAVKGQVFWVMKKTWKGLDTHSGPHRDVPEIPEDVEDSIEGTIKFLIAVQEVEFWVDPEDV